MAASAGEGPLLQQIASRMPYLPQALRQVAEHVLAQPDDIQSMTITALARAAGVAESTVSRFTREMGLPNYQALRLGIAESTFAKRSGAEAPRSFVYDGISPDDPLDQIIGKIQHSSQHTLEQTAARLDAVKALQAVELVERASTLVFACMGSSSIAAEEGVMRFTRAGKKCVLYRDQSIQAMFATILGPDDVLIAISDSGHSTAVVEMVRTARQGGAGTIALTSQPDSPLAKASEVILYTASVPSGGALYGEAVTAKWGQLMAVDVLYAAFASRNSAATLAHLEATYAAGIKHSRS
jgi:RpiR family carbohydrate utilization transcriptional regulator